MTIYSNTDGDVLSLNADSLTLTAECNHVLYKPCIVININKPHLETVSACFSKCPGWTQNQAHLPVLSVSSR